MLMPFAFASPAITHVPEMLTTAYIPPEEPTLNETNPGGPCKYTGLPGEKSEKPAAIIVPVDESRAIENACVMSVVGTSVHTRPSGDVAIAATPSSWIAATNNDVFVSHTASWNVAAGWPGMNTCAVHVVPFEDVAYFCVPPL